ncbi:hypothetical protein LSH36_401g00067 [Paralvinella palmiformis]|uniref:Sulfatase N-terminal domain-containing protein n=1 Tax=Paralvinella palmiformis TaxID=53620 RepID=A0AAD9N037_9ANNE|nr:hypothetical protein LSH36_401g00067 [Paralvinella palmiformis]
MLRKRIFRVTVTSLIVYFLLYICLFDVHTTTDRREETGSSSVEGTTRRMNVLFIIADDMRPDLGIYRDAEERSTPSSPVVNTVTPNLDRLAGRSIVFRRAYAQYSLCGPSRTSLLTSRRPDTTRVFGNFHYWRLTGGDFTTLPQYFKRMGYRTLSAGKVFHPSTASSNDSDAISWSEPVFCKNKDRLFEDRSRWPGWNVVHERNRKGTLLTDEYSVKYIARRLAKLADQARTGRRPIFVALGLRKPHLSLTCPEKFFDLYPEDDEFYQLADYEGGSIATRDKLSITDLELGRLRRAYFACVSYVDDLVGRILNAVESLGLSNNTVVVFMADHGYHLGEKNYFGKYRTSEVANHVPMMLSVPGRTDNGTDSWSLVEVVDVFPTIVEAAGLGTIPRCADLPPGTDLCTEGVSLLPLADDPKGVVRDSALSQVLRRQGMQYSLRTTRYRYTMFAHVRHRLDERSGLYAVNVYWDPPGLWTELFDHVTDPEEKINRTSDSNYQNIKQELVDQLKARVQTVRGVPVVLPAAGSVDFSVIDT